MIMNRFALQSITTVLCFENVLPKLKFANASAPQSPPSIQAFVGVDVETCYARNKGGEMWKGGGKGKGDSE